MTENRLNGLCILSLIDEKKEELQQTILSRFCEDPRRFTSCNLANNDTTLSTDSDCINKNLLTLILVKCCYVTTSTSAHSFYKTKQMLQNILSIHNQVRDIFSDSVLPFWKGSIIFSFPQDFIL
ncbi:zinc finger MYM-type protein 1-like [Aphis craccivora]|uniref:Zinc finger MYM-type protein 1-like n=1 Tax=Aphis craccivora TaxID=307492 RepID=A0A6G0Y101_APHCR|nr:zinc finger MYM-type protein 1-like [Aphis craccivora]